jgi:hypothetical protein
MKKLALLLAFMGLTACSTLQDGSAQKLGFELVTKVATSEALKGDKDKAETVVTVTDLLIEAIETGEITTPPQIDEAIRDLVLSSDLEPSSKQAILTLTDSVKAHYLKRIALGQLDPATTALIKDILTWVNTAANDTLRYGAVNTYGAPAIEEELDESLWGWITSRDTREAYPLSLNKPYQQTLDPKWRDGIEWMLENPVNE